VTDSLRVNVNRDGLHSIEVDERFEADGQFAVDMRNHGESSHLHLHLDDDLSQVARVEAANHYVESGETRSVRVHVKNQREWPADVIRGKLKVVAGHGRETRFVDVVFDRTTAEEPVDIDPDLAASGSTSSGSGRSSGSSSRSSTLRLIPVAVLGVVAVLLAVGALVAADGINFVFGGFAVLAAALCAVAAFYLG
jgi:hypothetical protein